MMSNNTHSKAVIKGIKLWFISALISVSIMGCQEEESIITLPPDDSAITIASPVVPLLLQVARLDGSADNILDQSSCLTVVLPVTVIVDGKTIIVTSTADFDLVEDALDDDGEVEFVFPINVILPDYNRVTVSNRIDLNALIDSCDDEDDIECIDIKYPLIIRVYDINNQVSNVITISSDEALYNFLSQLLKNTYISIQFPVTLISSNGSELVVQNYDELETAILLSEDDCDDDDGDYENFIQILTSLSWRIDSFINDDEDQTSVWEDYVLIFNPDGTLTASNGTNEFKGTWETDTDDGSIKLDIQLNAENPYDALDEDWTVTQYDLLQIILEDEDDQEPYDLKKLVLKKI